jgi:hypothetical protein
MATLGVVVALAGGFTAGCGGGGGSATLTPGASSDALLIAVNTSGEGPAAIYGTADAEGVTVPAGSWVVLTYDATHGVRRSQEPIEAGAATRLTSEAADKRISGDAAAQRDAFETLLEFAVTQERAYLLSLDVVTGGFQAEAFSDAGTPDPAQAQELRLAVGELDAQRDAAAAAANLLGAEPLVLAPGAGPLGGLFDYLRSKIADPINAQARAKGARQDVALAFGRMTIQQQQAAFSALRYEDPAIDAADSATFLERLEQGDFDNQAAQIRNRLQNNADYEEFFDLRNIETARHEGASLVIDGADFYGKSIKKVLDKTFPGIGKGWDMVETLEKKLQQAQKLVARVEAIKDYLSKQGVTLTDEEATRIAAQISGAAEELASAGPIDDDVARIENPSGAIVGDDGEAKQLVVKLGYSNPNRNDLALRCKYTGPSSADASTQTRSDAEGTAVFTFDVGYAPKSGTYAVDCSLDTYIVHSSSFTYADPLEDAVATTTAQANPLLSKAYWCVTPPPDDGSVPFDGFGVGDAMGEALCDVYKTAEAGGSLDSLLTLFTPTPELANPPAENDTPVATETPAPAPSPTPCAPSGGGDFNPIGGLGGGQGC